MLTKEDFKEIAKITSGQNKALASELKLELGDLKEELENKLSDVNQSVFRLRVELREETKVLKRSLRKIQADIELVIKFFSEDIVKLKKRVDNLERKYPQA